MVRFSALSAIIAALATTTGASDPACSQGVYSFFSPLSTYAPARAFCSAQFPLPSCGRVGASTTVTTTTTSTTVTSTIDTTTLTIFTATSTSTSYTFTNTSTTTTSTSTSTVYTATDTETAYTATTTICTVGGNAPRNYKRDLSGSANLPIGADVVVAPDVTIEAAPEYVVQIGAGYVKHSRVGGVDKRDLSIQFVKRDVSSSSLPAASSSLRPSSSAAAAVRSILAPIRSSAKSASASSISSNVSSARPSSSGIGSSSGVMSSSAPASSSLAPSSSLSAQPSSLFSSSISASRTSSSIISSPIFSSTASARPSSTFISIVNMQQNFLNILSTQPAATMSTACACIAPNPSCLRPFPALNATTSTSTSTYTSTSDVTATSTEYDVSTTTISTDTTTTTSIDTTTTVSEISTTTTSTFSATSSGCLAGCTPGPTQAASNTCKYTEHCDQAINDSLTSFNTRVTFNVNYITSLTDCINQCATHIYMNSCNAYTWNGNNKQCIIYSELTNFPTLNTAGNAWGDVIANTCP